MGYFGTVKLENNESQEVWRRKGNAEKVLIEALHYIKDKDSEVNLMKRISTFLKKDFDEFERFLKDGFKQKHNQK